MSDTEEQNRPIQADMLLHDLRRFLHAAHDQNDALVKISAAMTAATDRMEGQETAVKRILQTLRNQVDAGVRVQIDADLRSHSKSIIAASTPLLEKMELESSMMRRFVFLVSAFAFLAGLLGAGLGVLIAHYLI
jgi:hypothetical protein